MTILNDARTEASPLLSKKPLPQRLDLLRMDAMSGVITEPPMAVAYLAGEARSVLLEYEDRLRTWFYVYVLTAFVIFLMTALFIFKETHMATVYDDPEIAAVYEPIDDEDALADFASTLSLEEIQVVLNGRLFERSPPVELSLKAHGLIFTGGNQYKKTWWLSTKGERLKLYLQKQLEGLPAIPN